MTKGGSKYMKIKVKVETGETVKVKDEKNDLATPVSQADIDQINQGQGFKFVGSIFHAQTNPTCVYYWDGSYWVRICW
jgi:hypothetical protein